MRIVLIALALLLAALGVCFAEFNNGISLNLSLMYTNLSFTISFGAIFITAMAYGVLVGLLLMFVGYLKQAVENKKLRSRLEKENLFMESSDSKVQVLENKVKTLEAALEKALGGHEDEQ